MPGGDTRSSAHYLPYPLAAVRAEGCRLTDADGHELLDFMNNFTSLVHGHAHPGTVRAVQEQMAIGSAYAAPSDSQLELSELLCERVPSLELLRFCSSGSEATQMAVRAARAFTGKPKIVKVEGGYHGSHDLGEMSMVPMPGKSGSIENPETTLTDRSLSGNIAEEIITTPFNRPDVTRRQLEEHADEVAALILEPMLGGLGMIPATPGYLAQLRAICDENEVLLIFDEVITLRLALGGVQEREGVIPDLTAMGKIIGGGLPVGAFGGRADVMEQFNPERIDSLMHASTFSGNALSMAAGLATMNDLDRDELDRIDALGERLRTGFDAAFASAGIGGHTTGAGSLSHVHFTDEPVDDARTSVLALIRSQPLPNLLHLGMLRRGIFAAGRQMYCISTAMGEGEVDLAIEAFAETLLELTQVAEQDCPDILRPATPAGG
ncbi:MAG: aspartate aminotransferase family protein [bacterium]|nr:aspartate aminotransferase family protein [bacterium]